MGHYCNSQLFICQILELPGFGGLFWGINVLMSWLPPWCLCSIHASSLRCIWPSVEDCAILGKGTKPSPSALFVFWVQMLPPMCATVEDKWDVWKVRTSACCLTMCDVFGWRMLKEKAASNHHYTHLKRAGFISSTSRWEEAGDLFGWTENKYVLKGSNYVRTHRT